MAACSFVVGDDVDFQGHCYQVASKAKLGTGWVLELQDAVGAKALANCAAVSACPHVGIAAVPKAHGAIVALRGAPPRPHGLEQVKNTFGDPRPFVNQKEVWESMVLDTRELPIELVYAFDTSQKVRRVRAHDRIVDLLVVTLMECFSRGVKPTRLKYGGCYSWRAKRTSTSLSLHTWGIAVDLEPAENPLGQPWVDDGKRLDPRIIEVFKGRGWFWGGEFGGTPDPQHFQWASGV
jgi:hypothetical protein